MIASMLSRFFILPVRAEFLFGDREPRRIRSGIFWVRIATSIFSHSITSFIFVSSGGVKACLGDDQDTTFRTESLIRRQCFLVKQKPALSSLTWKDERSDLVHYARRQAPSRWSVCSLYRLPWWDVLLQSLFRKKKHLMTASHIRPAQSWHPNAVAKPKKS